MKAIWFLIFSLILVIFAIGCSEEVERANPLDAHNERTGGVPPGMSASAGDSQVILSWPNLVFDGVKEYKIYRAHLIPEQFQHIATIQSESIDNMLEYSYTDTGLLNDGNNEYFYRLSFIDDEGVETPDPGEPQSLAADWFVTSMIPSEAPPAPEVQVVEDTDLQIRLFWEGYSGSAPEDLAGFRVYIDLEEGGEEQNFYLATEIDDPGVEFYIHANDYPNNVINFSRDGISKTFKVVAFDAVGVESEPTIVQGTSPNLPPNPPAQVKARWALGINNYEVALEWRRSLEPDVIGYVVYAIRPDGTQEFKEKISDPGVTKTTVTDRYVVFGGAVLPKDYYITAFDNTQKDDGKRDESEPSEILSAM